MRKLFSCVAFAAAVLVVGNSALAQDKGPTLELANEPGVTERFAGDAEVSGQFLSGLAYQSGIGHVGLERLRLSYTAPSAEVPELVGVRVASDDARYWA